MKSKRKITILGMGMTGIRKADAIDQFTVGDVWSLNNAMVTYPDCRFARYFELHNGPYIEQWDWAIGPDGKAIPIQVYIEKLNALDCPIYTTCKLPAIKQSVMYPMVDLFKHFNMPRCYFLGSPSLMLALAIYEHDTGGEVDEIRTWGIDTNDPAHSQQRQSWAWWTAQAHARGIAMTGSAMAYMGEYENDDGLRGLREYIEGEIKKGEGVKI